MAKYSVEIEAKMLITVQVEAKSKDDARELAAESIHIASNAPRQGFGTTLAIQGEDNSMYIDTDNLYESITDVTKI